MLPQSSKIPFGTNPAVFNGFVYRANDRLGNIDLIYENVGANTASILVQEAVAPSGYTPVGGWFNVVAGGTLTRSYTLLSKKIAFFGTGNTVVNVSAAIRNPADLRGEGWDLQIVGRKGWAYDPAFDTAAFEPNWPNLSDLV